MRGLNGKVAIVTASTKGIGLAVARRLAQEGCDVVISSRKQANVSATVQQLNQEGFARVKGVPCHVGSSEDRQKLIDFALQQFGKIDILVSNAAINPHFGSLLDVTDEMWDKIFDVNVKAAFSLSKLVVPHLQKSGGGSIVYVSSVIGYLSNPAIAAYGVSKTALLGLTKAMALACAVKKIRVNCVAPGIIKTDFSRALWEEGRADQFIESMIPMQRLGTADEISGTVAFLCSEDAQYITGETVLITGGMTSRL